MAEEDNMLRETIRSQIYLIHDQKVMLDSDLAALYGVETRILTRAVQRNIDRFPADFVFQLGEQEVRGLRSQIGISNLARGGRRYRPYVFTEQGVAMLSSVLRSKQAAKVNVEIMRTFVHIRRMLSEHHELKLQLANLERRYDKQFKVVFDAIKEIMNDKLPPRKRQIGFGRGEQK
jgi:hypothetical protein